MHNFRIMKFRKMKRTVDYQRDYDTDTPLTLSPLPPQESGPLPRSSGESQLLDEKREPKNSPAVLKVEAPLLVG